MIPHRLILLLLIAASIALQWSVRAAGFEALSADDFGRVVVAAMWARNPQIIWHGVWLPLHTYVVGGLLMLHGDMLWMPRLVNTLCGIASLGLIYALAWSLFGRSSVALLSVCLLLLNPAFVWLSLTTLTELQYATCVLAAMLGFALYMQRGTVRPLYLGAIALALASAIRFEAWVLIALWAVALAMQSVWRFRRGMAILAREQVAALGVLVCFPTLWLWGNYWITGDALHFLVVNTSFDRKFYGSERIYSAYTDTLYNLDPISSMLALIALPSMLAVYHRIAAVRIYAWLVIGSFLAYIGLRGGYVQPTGNYIRYLAPFLFFAYPAVAWFVVAIIDQLPKQWSRYGVLMFFLIILIMMQIPANFRFINDPSVDGLRVGLQLQELRNSEPTDLKKPVLIELNYWQYLAIHVATSDLNYIVYDRQLDFELRNNSKTMLDLPILVQCLHEHQIEYVVFRDPELQSMLVQLGGVEEVAMVQAYRIYQLDQEKLPPFVPTHTHCELPIGTGY
ncbi:MAG: hypothetical protein EI684_16950 [Candidatus Viridilinea halotolerans]|uniref:Glycosyltransferase RgtA/B/C/D-like domain-containing protein n=1 Tax=Candidatus Viridilinea halotolerans TaxID=2491704 RepID=A0A426TUH7_9CHLR|nr:MAG: hypothetical protein EI684_16950 [Candidatus Viridilinea halotolerans]